MQVQTHKLNSGRHEPAPDWAFNNDKLRAVLVRCMEMRVLARSKPLQAPDAERLAVAKLKLAARRTELIARIDRLGAEHMAAHQANDKARVKELGPKIKEVDTQLVILDRTDKLLAGVVYYYWHVGFNSVETAAQLHINPPHVRALLWRMKTVAGELGFGPKLVVRRKAKTLMRKAELKRAEQFARLLRKGYTWNDAKAELGDARPHNHYWRQLCTKHKVELPKRTSRTRGKQYQFKHTTEAARLRKDGLSYTLIGRRFGVSAHRIRKALLRAGKYKPTARGLLSRAHYGRIDPQEALQMRAQGCTYKQIGQHFGVRLDAAWAAIKRATKVGDTRLAPKSGARTWGTRQDSAGRSYLMERGSYTFGDEGSVTRHLL